MLDFTYQKNQYISIFPVQANRYSLQSTLAPMNWGVVLLIGAFVLAFTGIAVYQINYKGHQPLTFATVDNHMYNFNVYCPIDRQIADRFYSNYFESTYLDPNLYVVFVRGENFTNQIYNQTVTAFAPTKLRLMYCGWAREWEGTCENARHVCSAPGPMFHLPAGEEATIVYVNQIPADLQSDPMGCYFTPTPSDCMIDAKIIDQHHKETEGCTFYQTTNFTFPTRNVIVDKQHAPISPHIHGLQVRPAFDGNHHGWFNIKGDKGPGYFSLNDADYFSQFQKKELTSMRFFTQRHNMKVIRAPNKQGPGTLFYHDHAMKSTLYNVLHGMSGMYVLYDKHIEKDLPKGPQEKYFVFAPPNDGDMRDDFAKSQQPAAAYKDETEALKDTFSRNMTYRFRILNGHFENFFYNLSFGIYSETVQFPDGTTFLNELDPNTKSFPVTQNFTRINFTVIGTDSVLFDEPVYNANIFDLSNSERIDLLIRFSEEDGVPKHFNHIYLVVYEKSLHQYVIKHDFVLNKLQTNNKYAAPIDTKPLDMPYTNLSNIPKSQIVMNRMRILLSRPPGLGYWIQGHMMSEGEADAPKIGTVEDWYFVCSDSEAHPIHIHLVNFQVIEKYTLKLGGQNCTYYELDFYKNSKYPAFANLTYSQLCDFLNYITEEQNNKLTEFMGNYSLENDFVQTKMGKVSGLNVLQPIVTEEDMKTYGQSSECPQNKVYKYICANTTNKIREYYRRWRDNLHADGFTVIVVRIRWTETSYDDQTLQEYPYFSFAPEDALIEFPGYIYHCHLLDHEDKEMMRPYVLTPSDKYLQGLAKANKSASHLTRSRNFHNVEKAHQPTGDLWLKKAYQINKKLNCPS